DRVVGTWLERAIGAGSPGDRDRVSAVGAPFGDEEVPPAVDVVEVGRLRILAAGARPDATRFLQGGPGRRVDAHLSDAGEGAPAGPLLVPREVWVDPGHSRHRDRI